MIARFTGSVEAFAIVDVAGLARWIGNIPFEAWPQQRKLADGHVRPAMVTDLGWHGFDEAARPVVDTLMVSFPGCEPHQLMLSVVMPGHAIERHKDQQAPAWRCRVHVPLSTNNESEFRVDNIRHHMAVGVAYKVNTLAEHGVTNDGETPRVHFMFDVRLA